MKNRFLVGFLFIWFSVLIAGAIDATRPTLVVTAPVANAFTSNNNYTASGKASDNVAVAEVFYRLNTGGWETADTTNSFTNWTANLSLRPGTNLFSVYAVDSSSNLSVTNTVRFVYVVNAPLTVRTNGKGSISPDYNNALLRIGQNYTLTAKPAPGFAFVSWTGSVETNKPAVKFMMDHGYSLTANFVDVTKPTLALAAPLAATSSITNNFSASGRSADNVAVDEVRYKLNDEDWEEAFTTNSWTNWTANLALTPGTNIFSVYAKDDAGNYSLTNTVRFLYLVTAPLTVRTNGKGSISPGYSNSLLRIGQNYTLTATPGVGFAFTNWTDGEDDLVTNKTALIFRMASNLVFQANFVDVSKPVLTVTTPMATTSATNPFYLASGKATDNAAVAAVYYQLNGGIWMTANTSNNWTNWTAALNLTSGTNVLALYAEDTGSNRSMTNTVRFVYATAPSSLNGLVATVHPDGSTPFSLTFGANTFSQLSADTNNVTGVGNYTLTRKSPSVVQLKFTYTAPPSVAGNVPQIIDLAFTAPDAARFTNNAIIDSGEMSFTAATNFAMASITGKALVAVTAAGRGTGTYFINGTFISLDLLAQTTNNGSSFSYGVYSRSAALLRMTDPQGVAHLVVNYLGTNYGLYYYEKYSPAGVFKDSGYGVFGYASQRTGGNAPTNLLYRSLQVFTGGEMFTLSFQTNFFGQASLTTNFDNAVGSYVYARTDTNHARLQLDYLAPTSVNGATNAAKLTFFADNLAVFTNGDGFISTAVLGSTTNQVPVALGGKTILVTNGVNDAVSQFVFADNGSFSLSGAASGNGTFFYGDYSPRVGMVQLTFTNGVFAGDTGWLQLNYRSLGSGDSCLSILDGGDALQLEEFGRFGP